MANPVQRPAPSAASASDRKPCTGAAHVVSIMGAFHQSECAFDEILRVILTVASGGFRVVTATDVDAGRAGLSRLS